LAYSAHSPIKIKNALSRLETKQSIRNKQNKMINHSCHYTWNCPCWWNWRQLEIEDSKMGGPIQNYSIQTGGVQDQKVCIPASIEDIYDVD